MYVNKMYDHGVLNLDLRWHLFRTKTIKNAVWNNLVYKNILNLWSLKIQYFCFSVAVHGSVSTTHEGAANIIQFWEERGEEGQITGGRLEEKLVQDWRKNWGRIEGELRENWGRIEGELRENLGAALSAKVCSP